jgi:hypothetical protein
MPSENDACYTRQEKDDAPCPDCYGQRSGRRCCNNTVQQIDDGYGQRNRYPQEDCDQARCPMNPEIWAALLAGSPVRASEAVHMSIGKLISCCLPLQQPLGDFKRRHRRIVPICCYHEKTPLLRGFWEMAPCRAIGLSVLVCCEASRQPPRRRQLKRASQLHTNRDSASRYFRTVQGCTRPQSTLSETRRCKRGQLARRTALHLRLYVSSEVLLRLELCRDLLGQATMYSVKH